MGIAIHTNIRYC